LLCFRQAYTDNETIRHLKWPLEVTQGHTQ